MAELPFRQVDVFTSASFLGNPVAVVLDAHGLASDEMQAIARWTNLSETTFVLPPTRSDADYRVRIFTPRAELPFAGHPTIGTAHALLEAGVVAAQGGALVQECGAGLVSLCIEDGWIFFDLPAPATTLLRDVEVDEIEDILGVCVRRDPAPRTIDVGPRWVVAQLADAAAVLACRPDLPRLAARDLHAGATGLTVFGAHPSGGADLEVRSFVPAHGIDEDPVCGSGNGCVAVFLRDTGQIRASGGDVLVAQGRVVGRDGRVRLRVAGDRIRIGGQAVTCVAGSLIR